jgi:hypothetical protein
MTETVRKQGCLHQDEAAGEIEQRFGDEFLYDNANGNPSIRKDVLAAFRTMTGGSVASVRGVNGRTTIRPEE